MRIRLVRALLLCAATVLPAHLLAQMSHIESGSYSFSDIIDGSGPDVGWHAVSFASAYSSVPIVIVGPLSHQNQATQATDFSLSARVRNVTTSGFEIGIQRPEETTGVLTDNIEVDFLVVPEGNFILDLGGGSTLRFEAFRHTTSTVRSGASGGDRSAGDTLFFRQSYSSEPGVLHTIQTANDARWITTTAFGPANATPPQPLSFTLALEGTEVYASHGEEDIGYLAFEWGSGELTDSLGETLEFNAGRTDRLWVDRHEDGCFALPVDGAPAQTAWGFTGAQLPRVMSSHNTMRGTNGSWVRRCFPGAGLDDITMDHVYVHMEEDQITDLERTGIEEHAAWFAIEPGQPGSIIEVERYSAEPEVLKRDEDTTGAPLTTSDVILYTITLSNSGPLDVADIANISELTDPIPTNTTYVSGSVGATSGTASYNSSLNRIEWNGEVTRGSNVSISFRVTVADAIPHNSNLGNQATLQYDSDGDGLVDAFELSDDADTPAEDDVTFSQVTSVSAVASSIAANPAQIDADGVATSAITAILEDGFGNRVPGQTVVLTTTAGALLGAVVEGNCTAGTEPTCGTYSQSLQSTTTLGQAIVTATVNGTPLSGNQTSVEFISGPPVDALSTIDAAPTSIEVGNNQSLITVTLVDAEGNPAAGNAVEIFTSQGTMAGNAQDNGDGTYTQYLLASNNVGTATLSYQVNATGFADTVDVDFTPGTASTSHSTVAVSPATIIANGVSTTSITVTVRDTYSNGIPGQTVAIDTGLAGTLSAVSDNGDGTYSATLQSDTTAQEVTISFTVNSGSGYPTTTVTFAPGAVDMVQSTITANPTVILVVSGSSLLTATVRDSNGNPIRGQSVVFAVASGSCALAAGGVNDLGDGSYTRSINAAAGVEVCTVGFSVNGSMSGNTVDVTVVSGGPLDEHCTIDATPNQIAADGVATSNITVTLEDNVGNRQTGQSVVLNTTEGQLLGSVIEGACNLPSDPTCGTYSQALRSSTTATSAELSFAVDGSLYSDRANVIFTAGTPVDGQSSITATPTTIVANGAEAALVTVLLADVYGNPSPGWVVVVATSAGTLSEPTGVAANNGDGTYTLSLVASTALETANLSFAVTTVGDFSDTASVDFVTGPVDAGTSTVVASPQQIVADPAFTSTLTVTLLDADNHPVTGATVVCSSAGRGTLLATMQEQAGGTYTQEYQADTVASQVIVSCTANTIVLTDTAVIEQIAGDADPANCTMVAAPDTLVADASSTATITVTLADQSNNPISGATLEVATSGLGTVLPSVDNGDGSYTITYSAGANVGTDTLTMTVNGTSSGFPTETIELTVGSASSDDSTIEAADATLVADSSNSTTVTVSVFDAHGHALSGQTVEITSTAGTLQGAVQDNGDGTYTQQLQAADTVATAQLGFLVNAITFSDTTSVVFVAGEADQTNTTIGATPSVILADGADQSLITVLARDAHNNAVGGLIVTISTDAGTLGPTTETDSGRYEAYLTSAVGAAVATISFAVGGVDFPATTTVDFVSSTPSDDDSTIEAADSRLLADGSSTTTVTVTVLDTNGIGVTGAAVVVATDLGSLSGIPEGTTLDHGDGTYSLLLTAASSTGTATLSFTVDGIAFTHTTTVQFVDNVSELDDDNDGVSNRLDNCPQIANPLQANNDADRAGDVCDQDDDNDGRDDLDDNCPQVANAEQNNMDADDLGDACDDDRDGDGEDNDTDNCPWLANAAQTDDNNNTIGDACESGSDDDSDSIDDGIDNCVGMGNTDQLDLDGDGVGDACDTDRDGDGIDDADDNCLEVANWGQANHDTDAEGDACDIDDDNDGYNDVDDNCPPLANPSQDLVCWPDSDGDTVPDSIDNCPDLLNIDQADHNNNNRGDRCEGEDAGSPDAESVDTELHDGAAHDTAAHDTAVTTPDASAEDRLRLDGAALVDAALHDAALHDTARADAVPIDTAAHDAVAHDTVEHDTAVTVDATGHDTAAHDSGSIVQQDAAAHDTAGHDTAQHDAFAHDTFAHDTFAHDTAAHDTMTHDTSSHDTVAQDTASQFQDAAGPDTTGLDVVVSRPDSSVVVKDGSKKEDAVNVTGGGCTCSSTTASQGLLLLGAMFGLALLIRRRYWYL